MIQNVNCYVCITFCIILVKIILFYMTTCQITYTINVSYHYLNFLKYDNYLVFIHHVYTDHNLIH